MTWGDWCERWWPTRRIEASTAANEEAMVQKHISPQWIDVQLGQIRRGHVQGWVNKLVSDGTLKASSVRRVLNVFVSSLTPSVAEGILEANPAAGVSITLEDPEHVFLTREQFKALIESVGTDKVPRSKRRKPFEPDYHAQAVISFLVATGLRWGELAGLHWEQLTETSVTVKNVVSAGEIKPYPKGKKQRVVPLPGWARRLITWEDDGAQPLPYRTGMRRPKTGLVFTGPTGAALDDRNFTRQKLNPALKRAELAHLGFTLHDLRHTYASWLIQDGVRLEQISALLGHASWKTTQIYAHLVPGQDENLSKALRDPFAPELTVLEGGAAG
ncbi:tyrosine-type recombinase/integrase [Pseudoclavibacter sp. 13-3]|uniref:tyrosine-type recombinase/integrase n=1 Tax=Pseudoclavibacter sp. 13-3 TaxID=2901228 RepID=UPI001E47FC41|nr:site-specific integrase [Pseudoclavibacter sp. 13-3]MCD7100479.1 tyrosine-type recombinase/integrase [Pseudoclavibacter sp. 13-3]